MLASELSNVLFRLRGCAALGLQWFEMSGIWALPGLQVCCCLRLRLSGVMGPRGSCGGVPNPAGIRASVALGLQRFLVGAFVVLRFWHETSRSAVAEGVCGSWALWLGVSRVLVFAGFGVSR
eukprot:3528790-Alexandrium_andersonii.AAC.1